MKRIIVVLALMAAGTAQAEVKETIHYTRSLTGAEVEQVMQEELKQRRAEQAFRAYVAYASAGYLPFRDALQVAVDDAESIMILAALYGFISKHYKPYVADLDGYIITLEDSAGDLSTVGYAPLPSERRGLTEDELRALYNTETLKVRTPDHWFRFFEQFEQNDLFAEYDYGELLKKPEIKKVVDEALALAKETLATMKLRKE